MLLHIVDWYKASNNFIVVFTDDMVYGRWIRIAPVVGNIIEDTLHIWVDHRYYTIGSSCTPHTIDKMTTIIQIVE